MASTGNRLRRQCRALEVQLATRRAQLAEGARLLEALEVPGAHPDASVHWRRSPRRWPILAAVAIFCLACAFLLENEDRSHMRRLDEARERVTRLQLGLAQLELDEWRTKVRGAQRTASAAAKNRGKGSPVPISTAERQLAPLLHLDQFDECQISGNRSALRWLLIGMSACEVDEVAPAVAALRHLTAIVEGKRAHLAREGTRQRAARLARLHVLTSCSYSEQLCSELLRHPKQQQPRTTARHRHVDGVAIWICSQRLESLGAAGRQRVSGGP